MYTPSSIVFEMPVTLIHFLRYEKQFVFQFLISCKKIKSLCFSRANTFPRKIDALVKRVEKNL